jgi:hypothetical protein
MSTSKASDRTDQIYSMSSTCQTGHGECSYYAPSSGGGQAQFFHPPQNSVFSVSGPDGMFRSLFHYTNEPGQAFARPEKFSVFDKIPAATARWASLGKQE